MNEQLATIHASLDAAIQAFCEGQDTEKMYERCHADLAIFLQEFRTIGFTIPRQMNTVGWTVNKYLETPNSILISPFQDKRDLTLKRTPDDKPILEYHDGPYTLSDEDLLFVFSHFDISLYMQSAQVHRIDWPVSLVIIQNSHLFFDKVRIRKFYKWLAMGKGITKDTLILRVN